MSVAVNLDPMVREGTARAENLSRIIGNNSSRSYFYSRSAFFAAGIFLLF